MTFPPLLAIINVDTAPPHFGEALLEAGVRFLQIRAKEVDDRAFLELASYLVQVGNELLAQVIVNDRPDIARLSGAAGVHLGQTDISPQLARSIVGPSALVGLSTHSPVEIRAASAVDYIGFGPIFPSPTKPGSAKGTEELRAAVHSSPVPIIAIGGITSENVGAAYESGAVCAAVIHDLEVAHDLRRTVESYQRAFQRAQL